MRAHPSVPTCDDENDTKLFEMLQSYVLKNYPNPDRKNCLDAMTLEAFVYAPETLDLGDEKFLHIFKCAECTRELKVHREERARREKRLQETLGDSTSKPHNTQVTVIKGALVLLVCLALA
jgi:hypothetical protein